MLLIWAASQLGDQLPASWPSIGAGGLLAVVVLTVFRMVVKGQLIPGRTHREALEAERDRTRAAEREADRWEQLALKAMGQTDQLLPVAEVTQRVVSALPKALTDAGDQGRQ